MPYTRDHFVSPPPDYFTAVNPMKLVPAIRDGPMTLNGSNAICVYLAHKYGKTLGLFPNNSESVGLAFQWAEFIEGYLATPRLNHVYHAQINKAYPPSLNKPGCCPTDEEIQNAVNATEAALKILDVHLSSVQSDHKSFIASTKDLTFADAVAAPWIHKWHVHAHHYSTSLSHDKFPAIARYYEVLKSRPSFSKGILYKI